MATNTSTDPEITEQVTNAFLQQQTYTTQHQKWVTALDEQLTQTVDQMAQKSGQI